MEDSGWLVHLTAEHQSWYRAPLWGPDFIFPLFWQLLSCSSCRAPSLTTGRVCNLQCNRLVRSLRTKNHTLPAHLRLWSLFVASVDSQELRWFSNPPPHGEGWFCLTNPLYWTRNRKMGVSNRNFQTAFLRISRLVFKCRFTCTGSPRQIADGVGTRSWWNSPAVALNSRTNRTTCWPIKKTG
jgi:hypothetical protein